MKKIIKKTLPLFLILIFSFNVAEVDAISSSDINISGSYETLIGQWEPWPLDYRIIVYAVPSYQGSNMISWYSDRQLISPGESTTTTIDLEEGSFKLKMEFRLIIYKKSTGELKVDKTIGGYLPQLVIPGSLSSPKYSIPVLPLEEFGIPAEISLHFRLNLNTVYIVYLSTTGLNPSVITKEFQYPASQNIIFTKPSGVGANVRLESASIISTGSIVVSLGLSMVGYPLPFSVDFASVPLTDWLLTSQQNINMVSLKTPIDIDFSLSRSSLNTGDIVTVNGYVTPSAQNIPIQLIIDGISKDSTQTRSDGSFSLQWQPNSPGTFSISVKALESTYTTTTTTSSKQITVNKPPEASFRFSPLNPQVSENIQFMDESYDSDGQIIAWNWNFGDGSSSSTSNPIHSYSQYGSYTVSLTITDNQGTDDTYTKTITVLKIPTSIFIQTSKTKVPKGESIIISGAVNPSVIGAYLTILITQADGTKIERSVVTQSDGSYEYTFTPLEIGHCNVKASWEGDSAHQSSTSDLKSFNVTPSTGQLIVTVRDESGNSLSGATISSTSQPSGQISCKGTSDEDGKATFNEIKPGSYSFKITCTGYEAASFSMDIEVGKTNEIVITLKKKSSTSSSTSPTIPNEEKEQTGIPGFPILSVVVGVFIATLIIINTSRRSQSVKHLLCAIYLRDCSRDRPLSVML